MKPCHINWIPYDAALFLVGLTHGDERPIMIRALESDTITITNYDTLILYVGLGTLGMEMTYEPLACIVLLMIYELWLIIYDLWFTIHDLQFMIYDLWWDWFDLTLSEAEAHGCMTVVFGTKL